MLVTPAFAECYITQLNDYICDEYTGVPARPKIKRDLFEVDTDTKVPLPPIRKYPPSSFPPNACTFVPDSSTGTVPNTQCQTTPVASSGKNVRISGQVFNKGLPRISNAESVIIENSRFVNGSGSAIIINPCTVKKVIIRNNIFENWGKGPIVYMGWMPKQSECRSDILIEGNKFINTTAKWAIETKTSAVIIRNNSSFNSSSAINLRHGRDVQVIGNSFSGGYWVLGANHSLIGNKGGAIRLGHGIKRQDDLCDTNVAGQNYPVAENITLESNNSSITTFKWVNTKLPPSCRGSDCPADLRTSSIAANSSIGTSGQPTTSSGGQMVCPPAASGGGEASDEAGGGDESLPPPMDCSVGSNMTNVALPKVSESAPVKCISGNVTLTQSGRYSGCGKSQGTVTISGSDILVEGLKANNITFNKAHRVRVTNSTLNNGRVHARDSSNLTFDNSNVYNSTGGSMDIRPQGIKGFVIRNNVFKGISRRGAGQAGQDNGGGILIGHYFADSLPSVNPGILIEGNSFSGFQTGVSPMSAIHIKTNNVVVCNNYVTGGASMISMRHGKGSQIIGNTMTSSTAGIRIMGDNHLIKNNKVPIIQVFGGDVTMEDVNAQKSGGSRYPVARNITFIGNSVKPTEKCYGSCPYKPTYKVVN